MELRSATTHVEQDVQGPDLVILKLNLPEARSYQPRLAFRKIYELQLLHLLSLRNNTKDVCLERSIPKSPFKAKTGIAVWFAGKTVSPAFAQLIFWSSPPKKKKTA